MACPGPACATADVPQYPSPVPPLSPHDALAAASLPGATLYAEPEAEYWYRHPEPFEPTQLAAAIAWPSWVWATAAVPHQPEPAPLCSPHRASADASWPPVTLSATLTAV
ncbi:hypothetical protein BJF90_09165 [Pseudonocardia sp. CNS-004]|nr:hypothetical protein BJF90_09165 [Pseudonocardia sp. CNS-004]